MEPNFDIPPEDWEAACAELADRACRKCYGTGRRGFLAPDSHGPVTTTSGNRGTGQAIPCTCTRREYDALSQYAHALPDDKIPWRDAFRILKKARKEAHAKDTHAHS